MSDFGCAPYIPAELAPRVGYIASRTTNQLIAVTTLTAVTFPTETQDTNGFFTPGGSLGTVPSGKAGIYAITATLLYTLTALGTNYIRIVAGGIGYSVGGNTVDGSQSMNITVPLAVADTIEVYTYHSSGSGPNISFGRVHVFLLGQ